MREWFSFVFNSEPKRAKGTRIHGPRAADRGKCLIFLELLISGNRYYRK